MSMLLIKVLLLFSQKLINPFVMWAAVILLFYLYLIHASDFFHSISRNIKERYCTSLHTLFLSKLDLGYDG